MPGCYVYRHRVLFGETSLMGSVYFAHYLLWQGHCRESFLADHASGLLTRMEGGLALITLSCSAEFFAEARAFDMVEVRMTLERVAGHRLTMCFDFLRVEPEPSQLLARGRQSVACMRRGEHGLCPAPVPDELRVALARFAVPAGPGPA